MADGVAIGETMLDKALTSGNCDAWEVALEASELDELPSDPEAVVVGAALDSSKLDTTVRRPRPD